MGQLFAKTLSLYKISIVDTLYEYTDKDILALSQSDIVIISVPISQTTNVIKTVAKHISSRCILSDITSIKSEVIECMLEHHTGPVIGLHPLFGPTAVFQNETIVYCNGRMKSECKKFVEYISSLCNLLEMSPTEHDTAMNFIQGIEHFLTLTTGLFLKKHDQHPNNILKISSQVYKLKLLLLGRILNQDPYLYQDIIASSKDRTQLIKEFLQDSLDLINKIEVNKSLIIDKFNDTKAWLGDFTNTSQNTTDMFFRTNL